jgi:hypothetical protein
MTSRFRPGRPRTRSVPRLLHLAGRCPPRPSCHPVVAGRNPSQGDCIPWTGAINNEGYGVAHYMHTTMAAHRLAWTKARGPIPDGLELDHLCRNRRCVNVDHLEPVTSRENDRRSPRTQRSHCPQGHPLAGDNVYVQVSVEGWVMHACRTCRNERSRLWSRR